MYSLNFSKAEQRDVVFFYLLLEFELIDVFQSIPVTSCINGLNFPFLVIDSQHSLLRPFDMHLIALIASLFQSHPRYSLDHTFLVPFLRLWHLEKTLWFKRCLLMLLSLSVQPDLFRGEMQKTFVCRCLCTSIFLKKICNIFILNEPSNSNSGLQNFWS